MAETKILLDGKVKINGKIQGITTRHSGKQVWREGKILIFDGGTDEKGGLSQKDLLELDNMDVNGLVVNLKIVATQPELKSGDGQGDLLKPKKEKPEKGGKSKKKQTPKSKDSKDK